MSSVFVRCSFVSVGIFLATVTAGCGKRTPSGPDALSASSSGMTVMLFRWQNGERVMFVDNILGTHSSSGSGSTSDSTYRSIVSASSPSSGGYECRLDTTDGSISAFHIDGNAYDLSNGALFVIRAVGEQVDVHQMERDLKDVPFNSEDCRKYVEQDAMIRELLGLEEPPE